jgi:hypothetical protein
MVNISERSFEEAIECALLQHGPDACPGDATVVREATEPYGEMAPGGYHKRRHEDYDRARHLLPRDVVQKTGDASLFLSRVSMSRYAEMPEIGRRPRFS